MLDWIVNGVVLVVCFIVAFFFLKRRDEEAARKEREKALAAAAKDEEKVIEKPYSLNELREYDGTDDNKPLLLAVNYKVFDVTKGKDFYGKGDKYYLTSHVITCPILQVGVMKLWLVAMRVVHWPPWIYQKRLCQMNGMNCLILVVKNGAR